MKTIVLSFLVLLNVGICGAQTTVTIEKDQNVFKVKSPLPTIVDFSQTITITLDGNLPTNYRITSSDPNVLDLTKSGNDYQFTIRDQDKPFVTVLLSGDSMTSLPFEIKNSKTATTPANTGYLAQNYFYTSGLPYFKTKSRYNREGDIAYFYFDQNGVLLGPAPVNIDADDYIEVYLAVESSQSSLYSIEAEGDYNPDDLLFRPNDQVNSALTQSSGSSQLTYIKQTFGPFTSNEVSIKITKGGNLKSETKTKINKLYNLAIGVSFVSTSLTKSNFDIVPLPNSTNSTIQEFKANDRTLATFNVIFYWKSSVDWVLGKLNGNDHITRGRDVLKEATFWERLNPSFGVTIDDSWRDNFFIGLNFEFARGGNLSLGGHYGKTQRLRDRTFDLGTTTFIGTKDDIILEDYWKWEWFFGLTLDTRIINRLITRQ